MAMYADSSATDANAKGRLVREVCPSHDFINIIGAESK